jgi:hypothetical protein
MEKVTNFYKQIGRRVEPNQMPWIVITHGNKQNDPHGRTIIAEFFDSRFDNSGQARPRVDMPEKSSQDAFTWDCYRLDIAPTNLIPPRKGETDTRFATGNKSGERIFDTPDGFSLECRGLISKETKNGIESKPCRPITVVTREDWNEVGTLLIELGHIKPGQESYELTWSFLFGMITRLRKSRNQSKRTRL